MVTDHGTGFTCPICLEEFLSTRDDAAYCSSACKQKAYRFRVTGKLLPVTASTRFESVLLARASNQAIQRILTLHFPTAQTAVDATWGKGGEHYVILTDSG
jgi:hypothetical protein